MHLTIHGHHTSPGKIHQSSCLGLPHPSGIEDNGATVADRLNDDLCIGRGRGKDPDQLGASEGPDRLPPYLRGILILVVVGKRWIHGTLALGLTITP